MALHGQAFVKTAESIVWANAKLMVASLFEVGHDVVILDATNTIARYRDEWLDDRWQIQYVLFQTSRDECIQRAKANNQEYLVPVIERMYENFEFPARYFVPMEFGKVSTRIYHQLSANGLLPAVADDPIWDSIIEYAINRC
jgi:predicted kinase